ncbi:hypothetical protein [Saccharomonospora iraqiensis]|uniref:hypothetical protein n=1 Tax=Saccharomonospora iraqiensis TaxID=52698 RepID=UPI0002F246A0|nr:hypothetical protein [Saccharomonospora iraqiensis]
MAGALVTVLVTGFAAPGFFLGPGPDEATAAERRDAARVSRHVVQSLNDGVGTTLTAMACPGATDSVDEALVTSHGFADVRILGEVAISGSTASFRATGRYYEQDIGLTTVLARADGQWCLHGMTLQYDWSVDETDGTGDPGDTDTPEPGSGATESPGDSGAAGDDGTADPDAEIRSLAEEFVAALNTGDGATVTNLFCQGARTMSEDAVNRALGNSALAVDGVLKTEVNAQDVYSAVLSGTAAGSAVNGSLSMQELGGAYCVTSLMLQ